MKLLSIIDKEIAGFEAILREVAPPPLLRQAQSASLESLVSARHRLARRVPGVWRVPAEKEDGARQVRGAEPAPGALTRDKGAGGGECLA